MRCNTMVVWFVIEWKMNPKSALGGMGLDVKPLPSAERASIVI